MCAGWSRRICLSSKTWCSVRREEKTAESKKSECDEVDGGREKGVRKNHKKKKEKEGERKGEEENNK